MATPRGAEHRDLEQRLRNLEQRCAELASRVLAQRKLQVSEGDFVVSGGGSVIVQDGGDTRVLFPGSSIDAVLLGEFATVYNGITYTGTGLRVRDQAGADLGVIFTTDDGTAVLLGSDADALSTFNVRADNLQIYGNNGVVVDCPGDQLQLGLSASATFIGHTTTSSAANARLETNGLLTRSTSSRRYKRDIEPAVIDPDAVLKLEPRTWRDRAQVAEDPDTETRYIGFIAEELDALGLGMFVEYDDQGRPDALMYDRLTAATITLLKRQQQQLEALTARLDALENLT